MARHSNFEQRRLRPDSGEVAAAASAGSMLPVHADELAASIILVDPRLPDSLALAEAAERRGMTQVAKAGDVSEFWVQHIAPRAPEPPASGLVFGLTAETDLFVLEHFGKGRGVRLMFRGEHRRSDRDSVHSTYHVSARCARMVRAAGGGCDRWIDALLQRMIASVSRPRDYGPPAPALTALERAAPDARPSLLVSWVMERAFSV
ncbi:MAG: hypothetical protein MI723_16765 [Caulobacterales bacterium]|nr:hypothetical protein [Caulobacterales bacterium]